VTLLSLVWVWRDSATLDAVPFVEVRALQRAGLLPHATLFSCVDDCVACLPLVGPRFEQRLMHDAGRNLRASGLQELEATYRRSIVAASARDLEQHAGASAGAGTGTGAGMDASADAARYVLVTVPVGHVPGAVLEVVSPYDERVRFAVRVPEQAELGAQMVVVHP